MCRGGTWCDCQHRIGTRWAELVQTYTAQSVDQPVAGIVAETTSPVGEE